MVLGFGDRPRNFAGKLVVITGAAGGLGSALAKRFVIVVLTKSFYGKENTRLLQELLPELPGILNWIIEGAVAWQREGLQEPGAVLQASAHYRHEQDQVMQFLEAGARLNSILAKMDRGEGTFGLMLNDPTLYEEIKILVSGANRSGVIRTMIRMMSPDGD